MSAPEPLTYPAIHGFCVGQHAGPGVVIDPTQPMCEGNREGQTHTGPIAVSPQVPVEQLHLELRTLLPSPTWTIVTIQHEEAKDPLPPGTMWWWLYVEPGKRDEPDREKRIAARVNVNEPFLSTAYEKLIAHYRGTKLVLV